MGSTIQLSRGDDGLCQELPWPQASETRSGHAHARVAAAGQPFFPALPPSLMSLHFPGPPSEVCYVRLVFADPLYHKCRLQFSHGGRLSLTCWFVQLKTRQWEIVQCKTRDLEIAFRVDDKRVVRVRWATFGDFRIALNRAQSYERRGRLVSATI